MYFTVDFLLQRHELSHLCSLFMIAIGICFLPIHLQKKYPFSYTFYRANMRNDVGLFKEMKNESKVSQKMGSSDSVQK